MDGVRPFGEPRDRSKLYSVGVECAWEGPVLRAHVKPFDPVAWDERQDEQVWHGGIYAVHSPERACWTARAYSASAIGEVDLWGRIVRFELGYRAEYCMVTRLFVAYKELVSKLSKRYECDTILVHPWPGGVIKAMTSVEVESL
jgi:hypothetical protein